MTSAPVPHPANAPRLTMPGREAMCAEVVARLETSGLRSQLVELDTPTLQELCLWLTDREISIREAWSRLNKSLGADVSQDAAAQLIDDNAVYRFAQHVRPMYEQVRREHASRIARLTVNAATAGNVEAMRRVATQRLAELVAEKLVETDNLEHLSARELATVVATVDALSKGEMKQAELAIKVADAERRERKLQADLQKAELERRNLQQKLDELRSRYEAEMKARQERRIDRTLTQEDIEEASQAIFGSR